MEKHKKEEVKRFYIEGIEVGGPVNQLGRNVEAMMRSRFVPLVVAGYQLPAASGKDACGACAFFKKDSLYDGSGWCIAAGATVSEIGNCRMHISEIAHLDHALALASNVALDALLQPNQVARSEAEKPVELQVKIVRAEELDDSEDKRLIYGVVYAPDELDSHGTFMRAQDIEQAAHSYLEYVRAIGDEHDTLVPAVVVESYIAPVDMTFEDVTGAEQTVKRGSWILVHRVCDDEYWQQIKRGERVGYSIHGFAEMVEESI